MRTRATICKAMRSKQRSFCQIRSSSFVGAAGNPTTCTKDRTAVDAASTPTRWIFPVLENRCGFCGDRASHRSGRGDVSQYRSEKLYNRKDTDRLL
jgi:hypothetical protein